LIGRNVRDGIRASYLSNAAKHGLAFFGPVVMLTSGRPWMPAIE